MPTYLFQHIETEEVQEQVFHMNEDKVYNGPDGKQVGKWRRVWTKPRMGVDTVKIDPHSAKDFVKATNRGGTVGDLWDRSAELSQKRADKEGGRDPVREAYLDNYEKTHKGVQHSERKREKAVKKLDDMGIKVDFGQD